MALKIIGCARRMLGLLTTCTCFLSQVSFVLQHFLGKNVCLGMDSGLSVLEAVWEGSCLLWVLLLALFGCSLSLSREFSFYCTCSVPLPDNTQESTGG